MSSIFARIQSNHSELLVRCFDFSPSAGWVRNVDALLTDIAQILRDANVPAEIFSIRQIKEKFGGLRVHCDGLPKPPSNPSMEGEWAAGTEGDTSSTLLPRNWHFEGVCSIDFAEPTDDASIARILAAIEASAYVSEAVAARIRARIESARQEADRTCQLCGAEGGLVIDNGWHMTACEVHRHPAARAAWSNGWETPE
jgi:hypothetical protein